MMYWNNLIINKTHGWILLISYIIFVIVFSVVLEEENTQPSI